MPKLADIMIGLLVAIAAAVFSVTLGLGFGVIIERFLLN